MMTVLFFMAAYLSAALYTFRYSGSRARIPVGDHACPSQFSHKCLNCGGDVYNHRKKYSTHCRNPQYRPHSVALLLPAVFALAFPVTVPAYFYGQVSRARGKEFTFFKAPPVIESKQEKTERRLAAAEAEIEETNKRLLELGIDL
jgi:hypothetical protein